MSSALDDEDLALSINHSFTRRGSTRGPEHIPVDQATPRPNGSASDQRANPGRGAGQSGQAVLQQRLGQYKVIETLGEGSFGKVKLAVHQTTGQKVALKIISRRKLMARDMAGRIEREIQYLQLLRHPHIIKLYTVITTPAEIVMVLEFAGSELFQYIVDHGKMREDKARQFFQQIVCAVEYCHRHKIVHRDLKPENLLLDDQLHVKIADFGLSNIMTDGNFLKTSCGSPNYAAPEVISGKLYAGPEVDVWSCGVILYVLLVGRLPFDDEYIPALFKKIAQGNYHIPSYLSHGAQKLIKKMLQTSPVNRITVQEIRQNEWFTQDLPAYLQPPVEEFIDTGVDPNKAIDPASLAPNKPPQVQERIHESVVGKLGKTMGYGRDDVHQALAVDEPNAIKDAYLIVRENQIMKNTPALAQDPTFQPFLAQSPPTGGHSPMASFHEREQQHQEGLHQFSAPGHPNDRPRQGSAQSTSFGGESRSPVNTIGVLPSSLPDYHQAYMAGHPTQSLDPPTHPQDQLPASPNHPDAAQKQSPEAQAATARRLKPHSRSQANLERMNRPEGMTPVSGTNAAPKKPRQTKWQFGIRSRNQPTEAMLAIYKALKAMGADWEVPQARRPPGQHREHHRQQGDGGSVSESNSDPEDYESPESEDVTSDDDGRGYRYNPQRDSLGAASNSTASSGASPSRGRGSRRERPRYNSRNDWGYHVPADPWIINARFKKDHMYPPGVRHPHSAHSSRADLVSSHPSLMQHHGLTTESGYASNRDSDSALDEHIRAARRTSNMSSHHQPDSPPPVPGTGSTTAPGIENPGMTGPPASSHSHSASRPGSRKTSLTHMLGSAAASTTSAFSSSRDVEADDQAYVYMTIQLYSIEKEFYLVDFKCAGYERLKPEMNEEGEEGVVGMGRAAEEKDVSSPFPFLDVASKLIIQLADAE